MGWTRISGKNVRTPVSLMFGILFVVIRFWHHPRLATTISRLKSGGVQATAMNGENLEPEKPLITKTSLEYNDADRSCQLWQVAERILGRLKRKVYLGEL